MATTLFRLPNGPGQQEIVLNGISYIRREAPLTASAPKELAPPVAFSPHSSTGQNQQHHHDAVQATTANFSEGLAILTNGVRADFQDIRARVAHIEFLLLKGFEREPAGLFPVRLVPPASLFAQIPEAPITITSPRFQPPDTLPPAANSNQRQNIPQAPPASDQNATLLFEVWIGGFYADKLSDGDITAWIHSVFPGLCDVRRTSVGSVIATCSDQKTLTNILRRHGTPELHFPDGVKANHPYSSHPRAAGGRHAGKGLPKVKRLLLPTGKGGTAAQHPAAASGQAAKPGSGQAGQAANKPAAAGKPAQAATGQATSQPGACAAHAHPAPAVPAAPARGEPPPGAAAGASPRLEDGGQKGKRAHAGALEQVPLQPASSKQADAAIPSVPAAAAADCGGGESPQPVVGYVPPRLAALDAARAVNIGPIPGAGSALSIGGEGSPPCDRGPQLHGSRRRASRSQTTSPVSAPSPPPLRWADIGGENSESDDGSRTGPDGPVPRKSAATIGGGEQAPAGGAAAEKGNSLEPDQASGELDQGVPASFQDSQEEPAVRPGRPRNHPQLPARVPEGASGRTRSRSRAAEMDPEHPPDESQDRPGDSQPLSEPQPAPDQVLEKAAAGLLGPIGGGPSSLKAPAIGPAKLPLTASEASKIRKTYTEGQGGIWTPGVKAWSALQQQRRTGHTAVSIKGDGNCLYGGLVAANDRLAFSDHRSSRRAADKFVPYKNTTAKYYEGAEFYRLRRSPAFNDNFPELQLESNGIPHEAADIEKHLATDNCSASLAVCQLAALAFKIDIHIQRLSNLDSDPIILLGGRPNVGALRCSVHLLFRENNLPIYDENFVEIGRTEGHFWLEDRGSTTNGVGPAPSTPARRGNGTGSGLIRP